MSLAAIVQHVQVVEDCGLVLSAKAGQGSHLPDQSARLERVGQTWVAERRMLMERRLDRLSEILGGPPPKRPPHNPNRKKPGPPPPPPQTQDQLRSKKP